MTATKKTLYALLPDGTVATRTTARTYTHAIAVRRDENDTWGACSFHGTEAAAIKALAATRRTYAGQFEMVTVQDTEPVAQVEETVEVAEVAETTASDTAVTVHVDYVSASSAVVLVTGTSATTAPQARLSDGGFGWDLEDEDNGITFVCGVDADSMVNAYTKRLAKRLGFDARTATVTVSREY